MKWNPVNGLNNLNRASLTYWINSIKRIHINQKHDFQDIEIVYFCLLIQRKGKVALLLLPFLLLAGLMGLGAGEVAALADVADAGLHACRGAVPGHTYRHAGMFCRKHETFGILSPKDFVLVLLLSS